jgi:hypothetical protein
MLGEQNQKDRIPRIGADFDNGPWVSRQKLRFKVAAHYRRQPYFAFSALNELKNRALRR